MNSIASLRAELKGRGWYQKAPEKVLRELAFHVFISLGGIVVFVTTDSLLVQGLALLLSTAGTMGVASNTHTSSHYATSTKRWVNELLTYFGYPFFVQLSATYWWNKHVVLHHSAPNMLGVDQDVDLSPLFAITEPQVTQSSGIRRLYFGMQWLVIPFALAANGFNFQVKGWQYLLRALCDPQRRKTAHWVDVGMMLLHWGVWIGVPSVFLPVSYVLELYVARIICLGYTLFSVLAPAHFPAEAVCIKKNEKKYDFFLLQTAATVNFRTGVIGRFLCSGLEFQIEHHLFPGVSHVYYPRMSSLVQEFCERHGYPYRTLGWREAIWKSFSVFRTPKKVEASLEMFQRQAGKIPAGGMANVNE
jgi:fatty acid desaturase